MKPGTRFGAAASVLLVCIAAGCGPGGSASDPDSPRGHLQEIVDALVDADSARLVHLVEDPSHTSSTALLTDAEPARGALASQHVAVERTRSSLGSVRYAVRVAGQPGPPWLEPELTRHDDPRIITGLPEVSLQGQGVTTVSVDGQPVDIEALPSEGRLFYLPPGRHTIQVGGTGRFVTYSRAQTIDTRDRPGQDLEFTARLTAAGRARVQHQVAAFVERCTRPRRGSTPVRCPVRHAFVGGLASSTWTLTRTPSVVVTPSGDGWSVSTPKPPVARMTGIVRDAGDGSPAEVHDVVRFAVSGTVSVRGEDLVVELSG